MIPRFHRAVCVTKGDRQRVNASNDRLGSMLSTQLGPERATFAVMHLKGKSEQVMAKGIKRFPTISIT
jgi:hypothetical protein